MLEVAYVTMRFPATTETFATNDVRTLTEMGVRLAVHSLRSASPEADALAAKREVTSVPRTYGSWKSLPSALRVLVRQPGTVARLLREIVSTCATKPGQLAKSMAALPRVLEIYEEIRASRPNVVHIYWGHYPSLVGLLVTQNLPSVVCTMSLAAYDLEAAYGPAKRLARRVPMVRTLGEVNVDTIEREYGVPPDAIEVIYDGVDLQRFPSSTTAALRSKIRGRVALVSRLVPEKGVDDALRAFSRAAEAVDGVSLKIMGDGPERPRLERLAESLGIAGLVEFLGHVDHDRVFAELLTADVFLFMSKKSSERLPNVVKEAMGCRALCVVTRTPGIEELIQNGHSGWIVPAGAVDEAADRVEQALRMRGTAAGAEMADRAAAHLAERFGLRICVERYVDRWSELVAKRRVAPVPREES